MDHFDQVIQESIRADFSPDRRHRYTLTMEYRPGLLGAERSETATVILKNPSSADEKRSDATIRKVETFVYLRFPLVRHLQIFNIFAFRATDAIELHQLMQEHGAEAGIGQDNDHYLRHLLDRSNLVIAAWGGRSGIDARLYQQRVMQVRDSLKKHFHGPVYQVCGTKATAEPLHGLMWGYDYELRNMPL